MTSLAQAKTINNNGVYLVGSVGSEEGPAMQSEGRQCLESVVRLTVPLTDEEGNDESKIYSLDELKDLQSKLMLIAGKAEKGKDDVETFVKVRMKIISRFEICVLFCWLLIIISFMKEMLRFVTIVLCRSLGLSWRALLTLSS